MEIDDIGVSANLKFGKTLVILYKIPDTSIFDIADEYIKGFGDRLEDFCGSGDSDEVVNFTHTLVTSALKNKYGVRTVFRLADNQGNTICELYNTN